MPFCCRTKTQSAAQQRAAELIGQNTAAIEGLYGSCLQMYDEYGCHCQHCDCGEHYGGSQFAEVTGEPEARMKSCHDDVCGTLKNLSTTLDGDNKLHLADKATATTSLASASTVKANEENAQKLAEALQADHQKKAAEYAAARDDAKKKAAAAKAAYDATFGRYQEAKGRLANMNCPSV
eukprot:NODE_7499_length_762_cov_47.981221_g7255_i0.p1 GENE.NODE_7499_length_762_cov_47.981221_g7255_i0~~NODE_7499_length_762_cov_47.981221_g7255_i0.p1  ORF type:complete len:203 (+),score=68.77 NODE_7499_length_762_cov_47.981221_g7255_i0:73-609(+)